MCEKNVGILKKVRIQTDGVERPRYERQFFGVASYFVHLVTWMGERRQPCGRTSIDTGWDASLRHMEQQSSHVRTFCLQKLNLKAHLVVTKQKTEKV